LMARQNHNLIPEFHPSGGHVGFVAGRNPVRPQYYAEWRVVRFLAAFASPDMPESTMHG
jgi:predicted alpha/beta-fold hydrolase